MFSGSLAGTSIGIKSKSTIMFIGRRDNHKTMHAHVKVIWFYGDFVRHRRTSLVTCTQGFKLTTCVAGKSRAKL